MENSDSAMRILPFAHLISQVIIALAVVASVTVLGLTGTLDAAAVTGILGAVVGIVGTTAATRVGGEIAKNGNGAEPPQ